MKQITLRVQSDVKESLESEATEHDQTLSEYMRTLISKRNDDTVDGSEYERLQAEHERVQTENDRLQRRVEALIQQRDEHRELVAYVEDERELQRERLSASLLTRSKWFLFGKQE